LSSRVRRISRSGKSRSSRSQTKQRFTQILLACAYGIVEIGISQKSTKSDLNGRFQMFHFLIKNRSNSRSNKQK
jgi:hypothetical protein